MKRTLLYIYIYIDLEISLTEVYDKAIHENNSPIYLQITSQSPH